MPASGAKLQFEGNFLEYAVDFFAGAFLCNCLPHLVSGLQGNPFPTPFATPRGVGESSPLINFAWGLANLVAGLALLTVSPVLVELSLRALAFLAGVIALGTYLAVHFGRVRKRSS